MSDVRNVLVVGNLWPYVRGGHRLIGLARYLHEFGWSPTIITAPLSESVHDGRFAIEEVPVRGDIYRIPRFLAGLLVGRRSSQGYGAQVKASLGVSSRRSWLDWGMRRYEELLGYPDTERGWRRPALHRADELLATGRFDALLSEYPFTSHLVASALKRRHGLRWVADFTDLWSQNHTYLDGRVRRRFDTRLERRTLAAADALVTVSGPWAEKLRRLMPGAQVHAVEHGFDPDLVAASSRRPAERFTIVYTGRVYPEMQDPEPLFAAVRSLLDEGVIERDAMKLAFYGAACQWLDVLTARFDLQGVVENNEPVPKAEAVALQREAQMLLLLDPNDDVERGCYTSKVYDYLGACRPILICGGPDHDVLDDLLAETGAGVRARTVEEVRATLTRAHAEYRSDGAVVYGGREEVIDRHSQRAMAGRFAELLAG